MDSSWLELYVKSVGKMRVKEAHIKFSQGMTGAIISVEFLNSWLVACHQLLISDTNYKTVL